MDTIWHWVVICVVIGIAFSVIEIVGSCAMAAVFGGIALVVCAFQSVFGWIKEKWGSR